MTMQNESLDRPHEQEAATPGDVGFDAFDVACRYGDVPPADTCQQIQNLLQAYATYTDFGHPSELAGLFTPDAVWDGTVHGFGLAKGAEQIAALVTAHFDPANPMMHMPGPASLTTTDDDDVVHGACWCMATRWFDGAVQPCSTSTTTTCSGGGRMGSGDSSTDVYVRAE